MFSNLEKKIQITISTKIQVLWEVGIDIFCKRSATRDANTNIQQT